MDGATAMQMPRRRLNVDAVTVAKRFFYEVTILPKAAKGPATSPTPSPPCRSYFYKSSSSILAGATGANGNVGGGEAAPAAAAADGSLGAVVGAAVYPLLGVNRPTDCR